MEKDEVNEKKEEGLDEATKVMPAVTETDTSSDAPADADKADGEKIAVDTEDAGKGDKDKKDKKKKGGEVDLSKRVKNFIRFGLVGLIVLAAVVGGGVYWYQNSHQTFTVSDAQVASNMVDVKTQAAGTMGELVVQNGQHVEAGDVIAHVIPSVTDADIEQLQQNLDQAQANLDQLKQGTTVTTQVVTSAPSAAPAPAPSAPSNSAEVSRTRSRMERMNELYEMGAVSKKERDAAASDYYAAQSESSSAPAVSAPAAAAVTTVPQTTVVPTDPKIIAAAEAQVNQAQVALNNAKADQQATDILAPVSGTVEYIDGIMEGSDVKASQVIARVKAADEMWIEAKVTPEQAQSLRLGQFVTYTLSGHKLQGTIQDIVDPAQEKAEQEQKKKEQEAQQAALQQQQNGNSQDANANGDASANDANADADSSAADNSNTNTQQPSDNSSSGDSSASANSSDSSDSSDSDDAASDGRMIVKISLPQGTDFDINPGDTAIITFPLNK